MMIKFTKDTKTIRRELFAHIESVQEEYIANGWLPARMNLNNGVIRGLIEVFIYGIFQLYQFLEFVMLQATPNKATGEWLDIHGASVDLLRKDETKARGQVIFTRNKNNKGNIKIPAGKIVRTPADAKGEQFRYITTDETILQAGQESVAVPVIAEEYGSKANAMAGLICEIVTPVNGISSVTNNVDWLISEGADKETDAQYFERYRLQWAAQSGVTSAAYAACALSVPGVAAVKVFDQHPRGQGTIDVVILGTGGEPTDTLLDVVKDTIKDSIIINDDVLVKKVEPYQQSFKLKIEYLAGNADEIKALAEYSIRAKAETVSRTIGADIILARLISEVINMPNIKRVIWETPVSDVAILSSQILQVTGIDIIMVKVNEE